MKNQVIHMILPDGSSGVKIVELAGWTGKAFVIPRAQLRSIEDRPEVDDPAIYFLFGEGDESTNQQLYIGESENFFERLINHDGKKDFWNLAIVFTGGLDKAKVRYLEYLSHMEANAVGRYDLVHSASRRENTLSESDEIITKSYFNQVKLLLSVLGYPVFDDVEESVSDETVYFLQGEDFEAQAQTLTDGSMVVLKGSRARVRETPSFTGWGLATRKKFVQQKFMVLDSSNSSYVFVQDMLFKTPSAAASVIAGRAINGWTAWKDKDGNTLDENLRK